MFIRLLCPFLPPGRPKAKSTPLGGSKQASACTAWGLLFLAAFVPAAWAQGSCSPPALGHPCSAGGVATQGPAEPGLNLGIGNPVNLATGNKHQQELDLPANPAWPLLQIQRHYNSLALRKGPFGPGWSLSYDTRLYRAGGRFQIIQADGSRIDFNPEAQWPLRSRHGLLQPDGTQWLWTWPDGRQLRFDPQGRLTRIAAPAARPESPLAHGRPLALGNVAPVIDIIRHEQAGPLQGAIMHITASHGQNTPATLQFHYRIENNQAYVSAIDTPLGQFKYVYQRADTAPPAPNVKIQTLRLTAVQRPDGLKRHYLYETSRQSGNAFLVTGIELASTQGDRLRTRSWAYDAHGRAILSARHHPKSASYALRISYASDPFHQDQQGLTLVETPDGRQTRFHHGIHAGRHVLLKVEGAPCPGCATPGSFANYDEQGRLRQINGLQFLRHSSGYVQHLQPDAPGWPGLRLDFDALGRRHAWHTDQTGTERLDFDKRGRPERRVYANGDEWRYRYDASGRPELVLERNGNATLATRLIWQGRHLAHIRHPYENESRQYDAQGRLVERTVQRPLFAASFFAAHTDRFEYGPQQRVAVHHLPEGGALLYDWGEGGQLMGIDWRDAQGQRHNVIRAWPGQAGYQYGNGLRLVLHHENGARALALQKGQIVIWDHFRMHDTRNRPSHEFDHFSTQPSTRHWRYAYDNMSRLAVASASHTTAISTAHAGSAPSTGAEYWHAWQNNGAAKALRHGQHTVAPEIKRDASGLPLLLDDFDLQYGPHRRLERVMRSGTVLDQYRHNAFGHRIQAITPTEQVQYFYLDSRLVAESRQSRTPASHPDNRPVTLRYIHAQHAIVGMIEYSPEHPSGVLYAVHADLMGAPRIVTDAAGEIRWLAQYSPTGKAQRITGDLRLDLRLPGQIADATTGLHDNLLRTYDPRFGHYLEPDPLGPLPGTQAQGYADQQPRRYIDPLGLLLFAFDGTRQNMNNRSNVWLFSQRYQDGPVFYHSGPGNPYYWNLDALAAHNAPQTIETQWQHLLNALHGATVRADQPVPIDIIGYSRGAALARHFGNLVEQHVDQGLFSYADPLRGQITACVDLRFLGLFDTVAQFGLGGALNQQYDFSIAATWGWVAHAVALHERRWLFPLLAATQGGQVDNVIEAPFVGAHADIGGGIPHDEKGPADTHGDLSDVALNWMLWQARAASVPLAQAAVEQGIVTNPVLHDQRSSLARTVQNGDRRVENPDGNKQHTYQDEHQRLGRQQRDATEALIVRYENWRRNDANAVGTIDMDAYARWLYDELGWHAAPPGATAMANHAII